MAVRLRPWPGSILDQVVKLLARSAGGGPVGDVAFRTESGKVENADAPPDFLEGHRHSIKV